MSLYVPPDKNVPKVIDWPLCFTEVVQRKKKTTKRWREKNSHYIKKSDSFLVLDTRKVVFRHALLLFQATWSCWDVTTCGDTWWTDMNNWAASSKLISSHSHLHLATDSQSSVCNVLLLWHSWICDAGLLAAVLPLAFHVPGIVSLPGIKSRVLRAWPDVGFLATIFGPVCLI